MVSAPAVQVRLAEDAESGFARIIEQFLDQSLAESHEKRDRASRLRGRIAMTASDRGYSVTIVFSGRDIAIVDGACEPLDAAIVGPYDALLDLIQGQTSPLVEHLRGRIKVRSRWRTPFFPLRVHNLMRLEPEPGPDGGGRFWIIAAQAAAALGLAGGVAFVLLLVT